MVKGKKILSKEKKPHQGRLSTTKNKSKSQKFPPLSVKIYVRHPLAFSLIKPLNESAAKKIIKEIASQAESICFEDDLDDNLRRNLSRLKNQYQETENPFYILQSFLTSHAAGLYPPISVLNILAEAFKNYIDSWGKKSLDEILKFKLGTDKKDTSFSLIDKKGFEVAILMEVGKLICLFNLHVIDAAHMVSRSLEDAREKGITLNKGFKIPKIDVVDRYNRKKGNQFRKGIWKKEIYSKYTDKDKKEILKEYPIDSIPEYIRKKYKIQ